MVKKIKKGLPNNLACKAACICDDTLYAWLKTYSDFSDIIKEAEADFVESNVDAINASDDWKSKAWMLEHRNPDFAKKQQIQISQVEADPWGQFMSRLGEPLDGRIEHAGQDPDTKMEPVAP